MPEQFTDTDRLNALQKMLGTFTGRVNCRWSSTGRGWRLHEDSDEDAVADVREAVDRFLEANGFVPGEPVSPVSVGEDYDRAQKLSDKGMYRERLLQALKGEIAITEDCLKNTERQLGDVLEDRAAVCNELLDACEALKRSEASCRFYRERVRLLEKEQMRMRDPERTIVCDILANASLLPDPEGKRYGLPADT